MPIPLRFNTSSAEIDGRFPKSLYMTMCRDALVPQMSYDNGRMSPMARASKTITEPVTLPSFISCACAVDLSKRD
jgi:hypothetical protein